MRALLVVLLLTAASIAGERAPSPKAKGKLFSWQTDGLAYDYRVPGSYQSRKGATLLIVFRPMVTGNSRDKKVHTGAYDPRIIGNARPDDLLLAFDAVKWKATAVKSFRAVLSEFRGKFKLNATILLGRRDAASFALHYAGLYPDEVQGVVADTPDVWSDVKIDTARQAHQAIVFHYENAEWLDGDYSGIRALRPQYEGLPHVRTSLIPRADWRGGGYSERTFVSSRPTWCEAIACKYPKRLAGLYDVCAKYHAALFADFGMIYDIARRLAEMEGASRGARARARKAMAGIDKLAQHHIKVLTRMLKGNETADYAPKPWVGYLPAFLMLFDGVPARDEFVKKWAFHVARQRKLADQNFKLYLAERGKDKKSSFHRAAEIIRGAPLAHCLFVNPLWRDLHDWSIEAGSLQLAKKDVRDYEQWFDARRTGVRQFHNAGAKFKP